MSSNVVTFDFFDGTLETLDADEDGVLSMVNVASRSLMSKLALDGISRQTVEVTNVAGNLFQKNGFRRLVGLVIFGPLPKRNAEGGGGGGGAGAPGALPVSRGGRGGREGTGARVREPAVSV